MRVEIPGHGPRKFLPAVFLDAAKSHARVAAIDAIITEFLGANEIPSESARPKQCGIADDVAGDKKLIAVTSRQRAVDHVYAVQKKIETSTNIEGTMPLNGVADEGRKSILNTMGNKGAPAVAG